MKESVTKRANLTEDEMAMIRSTWMPYEDYSEVNTKNTKAAYNTALYQAFNDKMGEMNHGPDDWTVIPLSAAKSMLPSDMINLFERLAMSYQSPEEFTIIGINDRFVTKQVGPLLNTSWHQHKPFNQKVPKQKYAGCVAIAMGQIMNFYQHPSWYNWQNMDADHLRYHEDIQDLMVDIGKAVNMKYKDNGSGAEIEDAKKAFDKNFEYYVTKKNHIPLEVGREILNNRRPVFMRGQPSPNFLGFQTESGHSWVCDGARRLDKNNAYTIELLTYSGGKYSYTNGGRYSSSNNGYYASILYLHMNWGWGGEYNGWFGCNVSQPGPNEKDYKYNREDLYVSPKK